MVRVKTLVAPLLLALSLTLAACGSSSVLEQDQAGLESLRQAGSDMTKAHPFDFFIYHPEQAGAVQICDQLSAQGFGTTVSQGALESEWLCLAETPLVPTLENLTAIQATLADVAGQLGGEYDGWETMVMR
jgi:hypothetical protein